MYESAHAPVDHTNKMELENSSASFNARRNSGLSSNMVHNVKPSKLGVVTYRANFDPAGKVYSCVINTDHTLTRMDNNRRYFAASGFVQAVECEEWERRDENLFNNMMSEETPTKQAKLIPPSYEISNDNEFSIDSSADDEPASKEEESSSDYLPYTKSPCPNTGSGKRRLAGLSLFGFTF